LNVKDPKFLNLIDVAHPFLFVPAVYRNENAPQKHHPFYQSFAQSKFSIQICMSQYQLGNPLRIFLIKTEFFNDEMAALYIQKDKDQ